MSAPPNGWVAPGFEAVADAFAANVRERGEAGAACAVVVDGRLVVDLWGGVRDPASGAPWRADTVVPVFSVTKGMAAAALALAHARGLLDWDAPLARVWPEFARGGKERVTLRTLLAHRAGLAAVDAPVTLELLGDPAGLDALLARQRPAWPPGERRGYHVWTFGWYASALLQRADPAGRRIARWFADEIAGPLELDAWISLPDDLPEERRATLIPFSRLRMLPKTPPRLLLDFARPGSLASRALLNPAFARDHANFNRREVLAAENPSGGGLANARALARLFGELARGAPALAPGAATWRQLTEPLEPAERREVDRIMRVPIPFHLGFIRPGGAYRFGSGPGAFGAFGAGGAVAYADPVRRLGFAYTPNRLLPAFGNDARETALRDALAACLARRAPRPAGAVAAGGAT